MEDIKSLFSKGQFDEIVKKYLKFSKEVKVSRDPVESKKNRTIVYRVLAACEQCGYYCDYLDVLKKLNELVPLKTSCWDKRDLAIMVDFALESLLYCLYNKELDKLDIKYNIPEQIEKIIDFQNSIIQNPNSTYSDTRKKELQALYEDYKNNHYPIYTIEYLYPFEPIVKDYTFDLSPCYPYISMEVKEVQRGNDNYTSFKFKAYGLIKPDTFWRGPKYDTQEKMPPVKKSLDIANMMLLQAVKASPGKIVLPYSINQVSTVSMFQYRWDEKEPILGGTITGTDFTADWVGTNTQWHQFTNDEMLELNKRIISTYKCEPFVVTFHHATNLFSGGFYVEAFTLLCSCCEGMVYYWLEEIAELYHILDKYKTYKVEKVSKCDTCDFYVKSQKKKTKPDDGRIPSLFSNVSFMRKQNCITKEEERSIHQLISLVRSENLRNRTVHGDNDIITKQIVEQSLQGILDLQELLTRIVNNKKQEEMN